MTPVNPPRLAGPEQFAAWRAARGRPRRPATGPRPVRGAGRGRRRGRPPRGRDGHRHPAPDGDGHGRAELVATELGTNLLRHAEPGGWLLVRPLPPALDRDDRRRPRARHPRPGRRPRRAGRPSPRGWAAAWRRCGGPRRGSTSTRGRARGTVVLVGRRPRVDRGVAGHVPAAPGTAGGPASRSGSPSRAATGGRSPRTTATLRWRSSTGSATAPKASVADRHGAGRVRGRPHRHRRASPPAPTSGCARPAARR